MDSVAITPNNYLPKYNNDTQQYEDQYIFNFSNGIQCPCSSTVFYKRCNWSSHIRTQRHSRWLTSMNTTNYYEECLSIPIFYGLKDSQQKYIIKTLRNEIE